MEIKSQILLLDSYIQFVKNSLGSNQYKNLFVEMDGEKIDILRNGELSCAIFVSSVLHQFQLIDRPHATVAGTVSALKRHDWYRIEEKRTGCVLVWEAKEFDSETHKHIGFFMGSETAISNSAIKKVPVTHDWKFKGSEFGERKIVTMYWHDSLGSSNA